MNQEEKICQSYQNDVICFQEIPNRFEFDGSRNKSCSLVFPSGYSIYVEEFVLDDPGPDNFVLSDGNDIDFHSKLKWQDRQRVGWNKLGKKHPLNKEPSQRSNLPCVKTLKVINEHEHLCTTFF